MECVELDLGNKNKFYLSLLFALFSVFTTHIIAEDSVYTWKDGGEVTHYSFTPKDNKIYQPKYYNQQKISTAVQKLIKNFTPDKLTKEEKIRKLQGKWTQVQVKPDFYTILRSFLPKYNVPLNNDTQLEKYSIFLTIKDILFSINAIPEKDTYKTIISSAKLETNNDVIVELHSFLLFPEVMNPFLHSFALTILSQFIEISKLEDFYKNNGRVLLDINTNILRVTIYPKGNIHHKSIQIFYHKITPKKSKSVTKTKKESGAKKEIELKKDKKSKSKMNPESKETPKTEMEKDKKNDLEKNTKY